MNKVNEVDVLRSLLKHVYMTCAQLGFELWQGGRGAGLAPLYKRGYHNCSCPFARPAGAMVKRLKAKGYVRRRIIANDHLTYYEVTPKGERAYMTAIGRPGERLG
jgi:hypothetical protein